MLAAGLTAFYMTRLMFMTFFGRPRWEEGVHPHESPSVMTVPMVVLAVGSVAAGYLLVEAFPLSDWLAPVVREPEEAEHVIAPLTIGIALRRRGAARRPAGLSVRRPPRGAGDGAGAGRRS